MFRKEYYARFEGKRKDGQPTSHWRVVKLKIFKSIVDQVEFWATGLEEQGLSEINLVELRRL